MVSKAKARMRASSSVSSEGEEVSPGGDGCAGGCSLTGDRLLPRELPGGKVPLGSMEEPT